MKLCKDCANYDNKNEIGDCTKRWIEPEDGNTESFSAYGARGAEWACGAEGRGFEAKDEQYHHSIDVAAPLFGPEPQAQDCPLCGRMASVYKHWASCSDNECVMAFGEAWDYAPTIEIWNRLRLAPEK